MIEEAPNRQPACGCGRPLRPEEKRCPHCERIAAANWKRPIRMTAVTVGSVVGSAAASVVIAAVTRGYWRPKV